MNEEDITQQSFDWHNLEIHAHANGRMMKN